MNTYHENQLPWPQGKPKTIDRRNGPFKTSISNALDRVEAAVSAFTPNRHTWRTRNLTIYCDGGKIGVGGRFLTQSQFDSPAVVVTFDIDGKEFRIATDRFTKVEQNLCGIAAYIESVRAQERYGIFSAEEMLNFAALPSSSTGWREVLGSPMTLGAAEANYRELSQKYHPDKPCGSHEKQTELNAAIEQAREELSR